MESKGHHRGRKEEMKGQFEVKQRGVGRGREIMRGGISLIIQMYELSVEWHLFTVRFGSRCRNSIALIFQDLQESEPKVNISIQSAAVESLIHVSSLAFILRADV